jgi:hypothetical protein
MRRAQSDFQLLFASIDCNSDRYAVESVLARVRRIGARSRPAHRLNAATNAVIAATFTLDFIGSAAA